MTDIREELMPRYALLFRLSALAAALFAVSNTTRGDEKAADAANAKVEDIRKALAAPDANYPNRILTRQRLRVDGFESSGNAVRVVGVFLDTGELTDVVRDDKGEVVKDKDQPRRRPDGFSPAFVKAKGEAEDVIKAQIKDQFPDAAKVQFVWTEPTDKVKGVTRVGFQGYIAPDANKKDDVEGRSYSRYDPPHLLIQEAANKAGAAASPGKWNPAPDRVVLTGARFGAKGELEFVGIRADDDEVLDWLTGEGTKALAGHPAIAVVKEPSWAGVTPAKWTVSAPELQKLFASDPRHNALFVDRAFGVVSRSKAAAGRDQPPFAHSDSGWLAPTLRVEGFQLDPTEPGSAPTEEVLGALARALRQAEGSGLEALWLELVANSLAQLAKDEVEKKAGAVLGLLRERWNAMTLKTPAEGLLVQGPQDLLSLLPEPVRPLQRAVSAVRQLDGVRIDPRFRFAPNGDLMLNGIDPLLPEKEQAALSAVARAAIAAHAKDNTGERARRYILLSTRAVSTAGMPKYAISKVRDELRAWARDNKDDVRLRRLFFPSDQQRLGPHDIVLKKGGGLVLVYQVANEEDRSEVRDQFERLFLAQFGAEGLPGGTDALPPVDPKAADATLPGLTAALRQIVAADKTGKLYGVFIESGYFDEDDRYSLRGVVDRPEQNKDLDDLLKELAKDPKWETYFLSYERQPLPASAVKFPDISMKAMIDRIQRVTPAYPALDGARVVNARYDVPPGEKNRDRKMRLVFEVHAVQELSGYAAGLGLLRDLLLAHPQYRDRVNKPPTGNSAPRPTIGFTRLSGPDYPGAWIGHFSEGVGAKLLAEAEADKTDKAKMARAKEWIDAGILHYPNLTGVWFLSAYYHHLQGDAEMVGRDLKRIVDMEFLVFDGDKRRRARYEVAKDLQGSKRIELEKLWECSYREVKDGAKPITLVKRAPDVCGVRLDAKDESSGLVRK